MNTPTIEIQLKEIKQELKGLNQNLEKIAEIMEDYMYYQGVYSNDNKTDLISGHYGVKRTRGFSKKK